jgi:hypothetical protein
VIFFFDNTFPHQIPAILKLLDVEAIHLRDHFAQDTKDVVWLPEISAKGWVVITGDQNIRTRPAERIALEQANLITFFAYKGFTKQGRWEQVIWIVRHWRAIESQASRSPQGVSYEVNVNGKITKI